MPHVGLIIHVNVISVTSGSVIATGMTSVTIDTGLISEGLVGVYTLVIEMRSGGGVVGIRVSSTEYYDKYTAASVFASSLTEGALHQEVPEGFDACNPVSQVIMICYKRAYYLGVDNLTRLLPDTYLTTVSNHTYAKLPILAASVNTEEPSPSILGSIMSPRGLGVIGVYPAFFISKGVAEALKDPGEHRISPIAAWIGDGVVWGGRGYGLIGFLYLVPAPSFNTGWVYIFARPYLEVFSVYSVQGDVARYVHDEAVASVSDILAIKDKINCTQTRKVKDRSILSILESVSREMYIATIYPPLAQDIGKDDSVDRRQIYEALGMRGTGFEVSLPVGAFAVLGFQYLGSGGGSNVSGSALALAGIQASLSLMGDYEIAWWIQNNGRCEWVPGCVDTGKDVYVLVSDVGYIQFPSWWCVGCEPMYYNVAAGTYLRLD